MLPGPPEASAKESPSAKAGEPAAKARRRAPGFASLRLAVQPGPGPRLPVTVPHGVRAGTGSGSPDLTVTRTRTQARTRSPGREPEPRRHGVNGRKSQVATLIIHFRHKLHSFAGAKCAPANTHTHTHTHTHVYTHT